MSLRTFPFEAGPDGYRRRVALLKDAQPDEPWSVAGERAADEGDTAAGRPGGAFFAEVDGDVVGFARFRADPEDRTAGRRRVWVMVAHRARRRRAGSALLAAVGRAAAASGAGEFFATTRLDEPDGQAFARARGFTEVGGEVELHLDLARRPPTQAAAGPRVPGIRISTPAAEGAADPSRLEQHYRLYCALGPGVLWDPALPPPGPDAFRCRLESGELLPEGTAVAVLGGEWVGLSELMRSGDDRFTAYQELAGVLPPYRRQGVGAALVAASAVRAREAGYRRLLTSTGLGNRPMQLLLARLGFREVTRWSHLVGPVPDLGSTQEVES